MRRLLTKLIDGILWLILHVCGIECTFGQVEDRGYTRPPEPLPNASPLSDTLLAIAREEFDHATDRRKALDDKARMLLTMVGILLPLTVLILPKLSMPEFGIAAMACLVAAALMLGTYLGIGADMAPHLGPTDLTISEDDLKAALVRDLASSTQYNQGRTGFLVDVFRAALRAFLLSVILTAAAVAITYLRPTPPTPPRASGLARPPQESVRANSPSNTAAPQPGPATPQAAKATHQ